MHERYNKAVHNAGEMVDNLKKVGSFIKGMFSGKDDKDK